MASHGAVTAFANVAAAGTDTSVIAAVSDQRIEVISAALVCGGTATTIVFNTKPAGAGSAISATFSLGVNGVLVLPESFRGWFTTNVGEGLTATTGAGSTIAVHLVYRLLPSGK